MTIRLDKILEELKVNRTTSKILLAYMLRVTMDGDMKRGYRTFGTDCAITVLMTQYLSVNGNTLVLDKHVRWLRLDLKKTTMMNNSNNNNN